MMNIVQVIAFKTIVATILEKGSTNYAPISAFTTEYPVIVSRVMDDHPEFLCGNKTIISICNQILSVVKAESSESKEQEGKVSEDPVDVALVASQTVASSVPSYEAEIIGDGATAGDVE